MLIQVHSACLAKTEILVNFSLYERRQASVDLRIMQIHRRNHCHISLSPSTSTIERSELIIQMSWSKRTTQVSEGHLTDWFRVIQKFRQSERLTITLSNPSALHPWAQSRRVLINGVYIDDLNTEIVHEHAIQNRRSSSQPLKIVRRKYSNSYSTIFRQGSIWTERREHETKKSERKGSLPIRMLMPIDTLVKAIIKPSAWLLAN